VLGASDDPRPVTTDDAETTFEGGVMPRNKRSALDLTILNRQLGRGYRLRGESPAEIAVSSAVERRGAFPSSCRSSCRGGQDEGWTWFAQGVSGILNGEPWGDATQFRIC
jgi:hypothetical protein